MSEPAGPAMDVLIERGAKRTFASVLAWPGWCRSAKGGTTTRVDDGVEGALGALTRYEQRYAEVARRAAPEIWVPGRALTVIETLPGTATTDFGAPDAKATEEADPLDADRAEVFTQLFQESWRLLGEVAENAPAQLRKGPRGGGRDTADIVRHVAAAEASYARALGLKGLQPWAAGKPADTADPAAPARHTDRDRVAEALRPTLVEPTPSSGWAARYEVRRMVWHVLDHAWEIEDRADT